MAIVGGEEAPANSVPFQVSLQQLHRGRWYHFCGGSVFNENTIITAAHCIV